MFQVGTEGDTDNVHLNHKVLIDLTPGPCSFFSLDYLKNMKKAIPTDGDVTFELGEEFPVKLHFEIVEGNGQADVPLGERCRPSVAVVVFEFDSTTSR